MVRCVHHQGDVRREQFRASGPSDPCRTRVRPTLEFAYACDSAFDGLLFQRASCSARNSAERPCTMASRS